MNLLMSTLMFFILVLFPTQLHARNLNFSKVEATGKGCPVGTTDIITSPDGKTISLLFNEMIVELPQFNGENDNHLDIDGRGRASRFNQNLAQKVCNILIEADVPSGHKVDSVDVKIDFRGSTFMDKETSAFFHSQLVNLTGPGRQKVKKRDFIARRIWNEGPLEKDWTISSSRKIKVNGNCSKRGDTKSRFNLRNVVRAMILPKGVDFGSQVYIGLDTADLIGKLDLKVNHSSCRGHSREERGNRPGRGRFNRNGNNIEGNKPSSFIKHCPLGKTYFKPLEKCLSRREFILMLRNRV